MQHIEPGAGLGQWQGDSDGKLDHPLKFTGLYIETHRQSLNLTKMAPVKGRIRLQDLSVVEYVRAIPFPIAAGLEKNFAKRLCRKCPRVV